MEKFGLFGDLSTWDTSKIIFFLYWIPFNLDNHFRQLEDAELNPMSEYTMQDENLSAISAQ